MSEAERAARAAEIRLLATLFTAFAAVKIVATSLGFLSVIAVSGGTDPDGSRTLYWIPQLLFYVIFLAWSRRLYRLEGPAGKVLWSLGVLSLATWAIYNALDFTIGSAAAQPTMAIAIRLRLLLGGDVWDLVFPALAIWKLRDPLPSRGESGAVG